MTIAILQARMSSQRLPGKVLKIINGLPMIHWQIERIKLSDCVNQLVVATSTDKTDDVLEEFLVDHKIKVYRGSLINVYSRFYELALANPSHQNIVRLTGDCPLVVPGIIDSLVNLMKEKNLDYASNTNPPTFPDGLDVEIFTREAFFRMSKMSLTQMDYEHVTPKFYSNPKLFKQENLSSVVDLSNYRWTVDYPEDFAFVKSVFEHFKGRETKFGIREILYFIESRPELRNQIVSNQRNVAITQIESN